MLTGVKAKMLAETSRKTKTQSYEKVIFINGYCSLAVHAGL